MRLVPAPKPYDHDLRSVFIVAAAASYAERLNPPPVRGTLAQAAILGYFNQDNVLKQLLGNVKTQLYRLGNRPLIRQSVGVLHAWTHEGPVAEQERKFQLFKDLGGQCVVHNI